MRFCFTREECEDFSDLHVIAALLNHRLLGLSPHGHLAKRLNAIREKIRHGEKLTTDKRAKYWAC